jgi:hypothetical protein
MKANLTLRGQFAAGLEALAKAGPVEAVMGQLAEGKIDLGAIQLRGGATEVERALLELSQVVEVVNGYGSRRSLPEWFELITGRTAGAITPVTVSAPEVEERRGRVKEELRRLDGEELNLFTYGNGQIGSALAGRAQLEQAVDASLKQMRQSLAEIDRQLGPLEVARKAGTLDAVTAAELYVLREDAGAVVARVHQMGLAL